MPAPKCHLQNRLTQPSLVSHPPPPFQGDSGGPVVLPSSTGDTLVGVTSWGDSNCYVPFAYYTRVADHLDWLTTRMAGSGDGWGLNAATQEWIQQARCYVKGGRC